VIRGAHHPIAQSQPVILLESGSQPALDAIHELARLGYQPLVSDSPGVLCRWSGNLEDANQRYKDILCAPAARLRSIDVASS
jgi:hypothetical protein